MLWIIVVIIPKGNSNYWGIRFLDPIWKVIKAVIDKRLKVLKLYDCLHGFLADRGTGPAITEVKLAQQLTYSK